jgi:hypothetical protein
VSADAGFNFPISQSANPAGAEACRYSENRQFFLRLPICGAVFFESL